MWYPRLLSLTGTKVIHCINYVVNLPFVLLNLGGVCLDRSCVPVGDRLYVIGGQEGDFQAKPGSPIYKCSRRREVTLPTHLQYAKFPDSKVLNASTRIV